MTETPRTDRYVAYLQADHTKNAWRKIEALAEWARELERETNELRTAQDYRRETCAA